MRDLGWDEAALQFLRAVEARGRGALREGLRPRPFPIARSSASTWPGASPAGRGWLAGSGITASSTSPLSSRRFPPTHRSSTNASLAFPRRRLIRGTGPRPVPGEPPRPYAPSVEGTPESTRGAIICEDDALLHNDWARRFPDVLDNLPEGAPLCALYYTLNSWDGVSWAGRHPERQNLCVLLPGNTWASVMYWISREYATTVLERWDTAFRHLPPRFFPELILQWSGGYLCHPPLALEDAIDSSSSPSGAPTSIFRPCGPGGTRNCAACEEGEELVAACQARPRSARRDDRPGRDRPRRGGLTPRAARDL